MSITDKQVTAMVEEIKATADPERLGMYFHPLYEGFPLPDLSSDNLPEDFRQFAIENIIRHKMEGKQQAKDKGDWEHIIWVFTERPFRLDVLYQYLRFEEFGSHTLELAKLVLNVWTDCEGPYMNEDIWRELFEGYVMPWQLEVLDAQAQEHRNKLSQNPSCLVQCWRGASGIPADKVGEGLSWTLDRLRAEWFALRWADKTEGRVPRLARCLVPLAATIGPLDNRGEDEMIIPDPKSFIQNLKVVEL